MTVPGQPHLDCPLCGHAVDYDDELRPGHCAECGARFAGGTERPDQAVAATLAAHGLDPAGADAVVRALFGEDTTGQGVAITSDRRADFYRWWVFVADTDDARGRLRSWSLETAAS